MRSFVAIAAAFCACAAVNASAVAAKPPCRSKISSASEVERGAALKMSYTVCSAGRFRMGLIALEDAHRGNLVLRRTVTVQHAGSGTASLTIGALQTGRYRLVIINQAGDVVRGTRGVRVIESH